MTSYLIFAAAEAEAYATPSVLGLDATIWVSIAMAVFLAILIWKKVPALIARSLDAKIEQIREQLAEAEGLRNEAEALRKEYEAKLAGLVVESSVMREGAQAEADAMIKQAEADAKALVERRKQAAEERITVAERQAVADVRAKAVSAAAGAAAALIDSKLDAGADKKLVDDAISSLG